MSTATRSSGRKDPEHPELAGSHLLASVEMKKGWAKKPTYWIEIYGKHGPGMKRIVRFFVYRQWSFVRGSMFDTNREVVEGGYLIPNLMTSFTAALDAAVEVAEKQVREKGYEVANVQIPDEVTKASWGSILGQGLASCVHRMKSIMKPATKLEMGSGVDVTVGSPSPSPKDRSKKEDFWDTARQREKKSKW